MFLKKKAGESGQKKLGSAKRYQFPDTLLLHTWHFYEYFLSKNCSQQTRWGDARPVLADSNLFKTGAETTTFSKRNLKLRELCWMVGHVNRLPREVGSLPECLNNTLGHTV